MPKIFIGAPGKFSIVVSRDGAAVPVSGNLSASVFKAGGRAPLLSPMPLDPDAEGADWTQGVVVVDLAADQTAEWPEGDHILVVSGDFGAKKFQLAAEKLFAPVRNSLFERDIIVDAIRADQLMLAAKSILSGAEMSDDMIWEKVRAAEAEVAARLRVPLVPTKFFPFAPKESDIAALDGMAWDRDPGYDYSAEMFMRDRWGYMVTRHRPIISVESIRFAYPTLESNFYTLPNDWLRIDHRLGHISIVPSSALFYVGGANMILQALTQSRTIPLMMRMTYTAGLEDAATRYPQLLDAIKKQAVVKMIGDAFLPSSGSISGDGLSQSLSVNVDQYQGMVDKILFGDNGNGGLRSLLHGVEMVVI